MQKQEIVERLRDLPEIECDYVARRIALATIETLCMHLSQEEVRCMRSQLPRDLSQVALMGAQQQTTKGRSYVSFAQFYKQIAVRAQTAQIADISNSVDVVLDILIETINRGEFADVAFDLPPEIDGLIASRLVVA